MEIGDGVTSTGRKIANDIEEKKFCSAGTNERLECVTRTDNRRIVLNIGGKIFETYVSTLAKYPTSLLGKSSLISQ